MILYPNDCLRQYGCGVELINADLVWKRTEGSPEVLVRSKDKDLGGLLYCVKVAPFASYVTV